jgi:eukaryotic-like serine/threonine-protein kinase
MLDAKYRIDMLLAVGGMGAVYVGTHVALRKKVAIKVLNPQLTSPAMLARFQREAITASQIGHEGIAQVTDLGTSSDGNAFLVMEFLEGQPLSARLKANGPMPVELACELGCAILSPLAAAHAAGIVHRDLKPDNVFLVRQSRGEMVKLLDFGISRAQGLEAEFRLTNTGVVMGTPYYMSPEQARGDSEITPASDIYSFGVILYEMLVGEVPIRGENYNQLMYRVMTGEYARLRTKRPEIPAELESTIERAMATDAALRWPSAGELEQALLAFCRPGYREHMIERISNPGIGLATPTPWRASQPGVSPSGISNAGTSQPGVQAPINQGTDPTLLAPSYIREPKRSKLPLVIMAVVVLGGGAAALVAMSGGSDPEKPTVAEKAPPAAPSDTPAAAPAPPPAPTPTPPPPPAAPATVTIKFAVTPANATIKLDGKDVTGDIVETKDDAEHELSVAAAGYVAHTEKVRFDESQRISVTLAKQAKATPTVRKTGGKKDKIEVDSPYKE